MTRKSHLIVLLAFAWGGWTASSAGAEPPAVEITQLTLREAVELALVKYPAVGAAKSAVEQARASAREATAAWFPTLSGVASATRYEEPMAAYPLHGFTPGKLPPFNERLGQYGLSVGYTLFDGGAREAEIRRTRATYDFAEASLAQTRQNVTARVIAAYLSVLGKRELLAAHERRVAAMKAELERVKQFFLQAKVARVEILRAEAALANAEAEHVHADASLDVALRELALLTDMDPGQVMTARLGSVTPVDTVSEPRETLLARALTSNPTMEQSRRNLAAARAGLSVARGVRWPKLQLTGSYLDQGDFDGQRTAEWNAGVTLSYPLFTGGAVSRRIDRARAASRGAEQQLDLARLQTMQDLNRALAALAEAGARVGSLARAVASLEEVVRIEKLSVEAGSGTQVDYLDAEADLLVARANLIEARHGEILARVELARLTGELDLEWISRFLESES